jgi:enamine deaminase RidA (YjgF/YER057c/UK114 family)
MTASRSVQTSISTSAGYRYSTPAFLVPPGPTLFIQGQVAWDADRHIVGVGDFREQTRQVFRNLDEIVTSEGGSLSDLVHTLIFVTDINRTEQFVEVRRAFFPNSPIPPSTIVQVMALLDPAMEIEIHATAVLGSGNSGSSSSSI